MSKVGQYIARAYGTPIGSPTSFDRSSPLGPGAVLPRYIRTLNGVNQSGAFNTPISVATGDTVSIPFTYPAGGVARNLTEQVLFDAANLLQLTSCTATIDGVAVASGASLAAYIDGKIHTIVLTATAPFTMTYLGQSGVGTNFYAGAVFDVTHIVAATDAVLAYIIDNADTATTYARGHLSPSAFYITWTNITAADIQLASYTAQLRRWEGPEKVVNGGFDTDTSWVKGTGVTISGGVMACTTSALSFLALQDLTSYAAGATYLVNFQYDLTTGSAYLLIAGTAGGTVSGSGTYSSIIKPGASGARTQINNGAAVTVGTLDNVSVKQLWEYI